MEYNDFLKQKIVNINPTGFNVNINDLNNALFEWQKVIVKWALKKGRSALFLDTGLGKTICQLCWADEVYKHTNKNILILAPLAVSKQTKKEGEKFGIKVNICRTQKDVKNGINITNYEMLEHFDANSFIGIVLDESSILKSYMGTTKQKIINLFKNTQYKLSCTATPSPNDQMEILNQAEFLGVMKSHEALAIWFINDTSTSGNYKLKGHAIKSFWEWVSSWAVCISTPSEIGYSDEGYILPPLNVNEIIIPVNILSDDLEMGLIRVVETNATAFHKEKRLTAQDRAKKCAEIVKDSEKQYLIWCNTDYEADLLKKYIPTATEIRGSHKSEYKEECAIKFSENQIQILISKPKIFGYGLNFQNCQNTIFCGIDYSYENYYQAIRRFWRFGQKETVNAYIVIGSTEKQILNNVRQKEKNHMEMKKNMYGEIKDYQNKEILGKEFIITEKTSKISIPQWIKE